MATKKKAAPEQGQPAQGEQQPDPAPSISLDGELFAAAIESAIETAKARANTAAMAEAISGAGLVAFLGDPESDTPIKVLCAANGTVRVDAMTIAAARALRGSLKVAIQFAEASLPF